MKKIADFKVFDDISGNYAVIFKKPVQKYVKGYKFELRIGDSTGEVMLKFWGPEDEEAVKKLYDSLAKDDVIHIRGQVSEYRDKLEVAVNELDSIRVLSPLEYVKNDFVKETEKEIEEMYTELESKIASVKNPHLKPVLDSFFRDLDFVKSFRNDPAALYQHHNWIGGLLEHTLSVVKICESALKIYPDLDRDLTITGAILHDVGKTREFKVSSTIKPTLESRLIGHIVMGVEMVNEKMKDLDMPDDVKIKLAHIIESHHGKLEWGSPKKPALAEALLIHQADYMDASLTHILTRKNEASTEDDFIYMKDYGNIYLK